MRAREFTTEAHHYRMATQKMGNWKVHLDSHAVVTMADRDIDSGSVINILGFACRNVPELGTIPLGKGAYFQDTNTLISLYLKRSDHYPDEITLETVLSPDMRPTPPLFRRPVPPAPRDMQDNALVRANKQAMKQKTQARGRDAVSQDIESMMPTLKASMNQPPAPDAPLNREQRRAWSKYLQKNKYLKGVIE